MNIEEIISLCDDSTIEITNHCLLRMHQRNISYTDLKKAVANGMVIENYPDDYPHPSCLIMSRISADRIIHIVVGIGKGKLWFITTYFPDSDLWNDTFTKRKEKYYE